MKDVVTSIDGRTACVREAKCAFECETVYQDINIIHVHYLSLSKAIKDLETCGAPLHKSLQLIDNTISSLNAVPGETGEKTISKLSAVLDSNPGLKKIQSINEYISGIQQSLPEECSEQSLPV
ncbi:hypothetical protein ANN_19078 [Periplaneta americana]|uniref:Uncharacterized protein n=1 Tax=Periplaneta americana TaxID=6978 RepID=A0ABQ8SRU6_PERAM|nr:hypothetical protein ANN_19078 [Periplaneta americana]